MPNMTKYKAESRGDRWTIKVLSTFWWLRRLFGMGPYVFCYHFETENIPIFDTEEEAAAEIVCWIERDKKDRLRNPSFLERLF